MSDVVLRRRIKRFGHVEGKEDSDCEKACRYMVLEGVKGKGTNNVETGENVKITREW